MTNDELARSYLWKSTQRLDILELLYRKQDYSDVVREAQEIVELCLKATLRAVGIEPPKLHDVGPLLLEHGDRFKGIAPAELKKVAAVSKQLRKEREMAFDGDIDLIPTEEYGKKDAMPAMQGAKLAVRLARRLIK